ncbi:leucine zipper transcription factor-like protein 1 [Penaeus chinensis]|uniref:leucine zipper transcription factor-like protein 1 n=1 Tax=Penaeus chinensis TaxID=139456 RepID=UPI001FB7F697|nr:leucine zipper transcription factor-like protein 1 [Penaeus chinensis]
MSDLGLNEHHQSCMAGYLRFTKYQRAQRLRSVDACFQDVKDTRLLEETYTSDEVVELLDSLAEVVRAEVEGELIHATHTNSVLLSNVFAQAQKWHLELSVDTSNLENQELLEDVRKFEEAEAQGRLGIDKKPSARTLAPLGDQEGPMALLHAEIKRLTEENGEVKRRLEQAESKVTDIAQAKAELAVTLQTTADELGRVKNTVSSRPTVEEVSELSDEVEKMRLELSSKTEEKEATQEQLQGDLALSKQKLAQVKSQLQLAEKELEKKFSQTGAYQNMKKMLGNKNDQIKVLRKKLEIYEPSKDDIIEE